ncbi:MAG: hypothetical protein U0T02_02875 [Solirubrobacteraceae bacterium]
MSMRARGWPGRASERSPGGESGQASVELVAILPLVAIAVAALWQCVLAGQTGWLAAGAARSAARAQALGADPEAAARRVLPRRLEPGLRVRSLADGTVRVRVAVPLALGSGRLTTLEARARLEPQRP